MKMGTSSRRRQTNWVSKHSFKASKRGLTASAKHPIPVEGPSSFSTQTMTLHCRMGWILFSSFISTQPKTFLLFQILKILKHQIICLWLKWRRQGNIARCTSGPANGLCTIQTLLWRIKPNVGFTWHLYRVSGRYLLLGEAQAGF